MYLIRIGRAGAEKPVARVDDDTDLSDLSGLMERGIHGLGRPRQQVLGPR